MSRRALALTLMCAAVGAAAAPAAGRAAVITQTSTLGPTTTDFNSTSVAPLSFEKFDTLGDTRKLDSVKLDFSANVSNEFIVAFVNKATITDSLQPANPAASGPSITLFQPDGKTPLLTAHQPNDPAILTRSVTYGDKPGDTFPRTFSSALLPTSPYYIKPSTVTASGTKTLTSEADLALFTKTSTSSTLSLPVSASATSSMVSSSGNGAGGVSTTGKASVTVTYTWEPTGSAAQTIPSPSPEPATVVLWGVGGVAFVVARRLRSGRAS